MSTVPFMNLIGSEWRRAATEKLFEDINPADTREIIGQFQYSAVEDVKAAIDLAYEAQKKWGETPAPTRGKILYKAAELLEASAAELAATLTREEGKTLKESQGEVMRSIDFFRFYASQGSRLNGKTIASEDKKQLLYTMRSPVGIVSVITPWNFPLVIPSWKIAPALIAGNSVVFKPASLTPLIGLRLVECLRNAGLPDGVINYVTGSGKTLSDAMIKDERVAAVSFTGSCGVGKEIGESCYRRQNMAKVQLEMGGKNPTIVLADADLEATISLVSTAAFGGTGQACTATSRVIVEESVHDRLVGGIVARAQALKVGNGLNPSTNMGPAVSKSELEKDLEYVRVGIEEGAKLLTGGSALTQGEYSFGYFISPTVFVDVTPDMRIAQEEIFGPILSVFPARDFEHALEIANGVEFGLSASICTQNLAKALQFAERIQAGVVKVNRTTTGAMYNAPFGGMKKSSSGTVKEMGEESIDFYTHTKTVYLGY